MGTALIYLVVLLGVTVAFFLGASAIFGRGEELAPIPEGATPTRLPESEQGIGADDVRALRFQQAVRGYKMVEVDWVLERLAVELHRNQLDLDTAHADLHTAHAELDAARDQLGAARDQLDAALGRIAELESAEQPSGGTG